MDNLLLDAGDDMLLDDGEVLFLTFPGLAAAFVIIFGWD